MKIMAFNSPEEMMAYMEKSREAADANTDPVQASLNIGDFFIRTAQDIIIYGEICDPVDGDSEEERDYQRRVYEAPHMKLYRFSKCYSPVCPDGEYGDIHLSTVELKISSEMFQRCKDADWPQDRDTLLSVLGIVAPGDA